MRGKIICEENIGLYNFFVILKSCKVYNIMPHLNIHVAYFFYCFILKHYLNAIISLLLTKKRQKEYC